MKKIAYFVLYLFGLLASVLFQPNPAYGQAGCTPIYGGGVQCPPTQQVLIDKTIKNPENAVFVDNLGVNDTKLIPNQTNVMFRLLVENTTDQTLSNVTVVDTLPSQLIFVAGQGSYDANTRQLTITINSLGPREKRTFDITTNVAEVTAFSQTVTCVVNSAAVTVGTQRDSDTAQVCIEKQVLGAPELPKAGPEHTIALVAGLLTLVFVGRKLSQVTVG